MSTSRPLEIGIESALPQASTCPGTAPSSFSRSLSISNEFTCLLINGTPIALPPYPGRPYPSQNEGNGHARYNVPSAGNHISGDQYVLPRSNTTPNVSYMAEAPRPPIPQRPSVRPKSASGGQPLPPSLMPGGKRQTTDGIRMPYEGALFFESHTSHNARRSTIAAERSFRRTESPPPLPPLPPLSRPALPPKPHFQHTASEPLFKSSSREPPTLIPKPRIPPASAPPNIPTHRPISESPPPVPAQPLDEGDELSRVIELSLADKGGVNHDRDEEDELLARALQESLASVNPTSPTISLSASGSSSSHAITVSTDPSVFTHTSVSSALSPLKTATTPTSSKPSSPVKQDIQYVPSALAEDASDMYEEMQRRKRQMQEDEELARRLAEEDENEITQIPTPQTRPQAGPEDHETPKNIDTPSLPESNALQPPRYEAATRPLPSAYTMLVQPSPSPDGSRSESPSMVNHGLPASPRPLPSSAMYGSNTVTVSGTQPPLNRSISAQAIVSTSPLEPVYHSVQLDAPPHVTHTSRPKSIAPVLRAQSANAVPSRPASSILSQGPTSSIARSDEQPDPPLEEYHKAVDVLGQRAPVSALEAQGKEPSKALSQPVVDDELLMGISLGFTAPSIGSTSAMMQGPLPNVIALPYGKCPPLHIQAPSWKHLLKLLARLSDSRIEPTVEAVAINKGELRLRTVVQFIRVHHSSSEWRTILYLSIDVPVPPQTPNAFKYINGDVSTLPFSYTMSPLPTLLRDGSDSPLARWYSVPSTPATPYPALPITLPNYALYLQAVLRDSRRAMNDSSSGLRRLAKSIDMIYPPTTEHMEGFGPEMATPDRHRVGNFFRRALGRGDRNTGQRGGNDESFDIITPFRIDEYN